MDLPVRISIHALHEESDLLRKYNATAIHISIHALHEESDARAKAEPLLTAIFQSTLSMRRATQLGDADAQMLVISIHALHEESDQQGRNHRLLPPTFQSTLSMRRATMSAAISGAAFLFQSTLSMRRATCIICSPETRRDFNPRSP